MEIQRLIGRSLRMMVDLRSLDGYTLRVDCDVLNADGGTRTASVTGAALAVRTAIARMVREQRLSVQPEILRTAAVSANRCAVLRLNPREQTGSGRARRRTGTF